MLGYTDLEIRFTALCHRNYVDSPNFQRFCDLSYGMFTTPKAARTMWDSLGGDKLEQSTVAKG